MNFELAVHSALRNVLANSDMQVAVDSTRVFTGEDGNVVVVSYHLEGRLGSPGQFTFPFVESVPLEESLAAFLDHGGRSWQMAQFAPGEIPSSFGASAH